MALLMCVALIVTLKLSVMLGLVSIIVISIELVSPAICEHMLSVNFLYNVSCKECYNLAGRIFIRLDFV